MEKPRAGRTLSDTQWLAVLESLPDGIALLDGGGRVLWANGLGRWLLPLRATDPGEPSEGELGALVRRRVALLPPLVDDERVRCAVAGGGVVDVSLRRMWGSRIALWMAASSEVPRPQPNEVTAPPACAQLVVVERMVEDALVGVVVANDAGAIAWMNAQARRLLGEATRHIGRDAQRDVARAARHVATARLPGPIRIRFELPARGVEARFWHVGPGLAGVLFDGEGGEARVPSGASG